MNITITGATGMIGTRLLAKLQESGHQLTTIGRRATADSNVRFHPWDPIATEAPAEALRGADAVIHLAGEPVAQRWSKGVKRSIRQSRAVGTRNLVRALANLRTEAPRVLLSASAIGYYGNRGDEILTEHSSPGKGFLPEVCVEWEREARAAEAAGIRVTAIRIGIVLGTSGGALKQMVTPFRLGLGGPIGGGAQWMSWIHLDDLVALFEWALSQDSLSGTLNGTAPEPVRNAEFAQALGAALNRPAILPAPVFAVKLMFGEMADVILGSQRVLPAAASNAHFSFRYPALRPALESLV